MTPAKPKGAAIASEIAAKHRVTLADLTGPCRQRAIFRARAELAYRLRTELGWSFPRIGRLLNRDHTTIMNQVRVHAARCGGAGRGDSSH
ncbi:helix-turn-helix domain-containing protein [Pannonibacter tanglangensis]|uniref:Chromosomal replication initiator DnaA C-terminal domain-containing protein n=1 Tax=Pannonibacter tanglangensis TaxID=2750084 RepID=A0ABW9ZDJ2_9HYPH|nr:helix-turn-helix domain-containing protein [Pannonibacter sp. XCT-34]NBN62077.1 hypothetical protein [Pannonibacter sp. XCT-34]